MKRKVVWVVAFAALANLIGGLVAVATDRRPEPARRFEVLARVGHRTFPVEEGSVITQGRKNADGNCVFDEPRAISVRVFDGDAGPTVRTSIDEECRVVVQSIRQEETTDGPPSDGTTSQPDDAGGSK